MSDWNNAFGSSDRLGLIVVDHGSRREESNRLVEVVADALQKRSADAIVQPAHMELAEPSIKSAFDRCVELGADQVIVFPFFLGPGRHWKEDIPRLAAEAASQHPETPYLVTAPLGVHDLILDLIDIRLNQCVAHAQGLTPECDICQDSQACQFRQG